MSGIMASVLKGAKIRNVKGGGWTLVLGNGTCCMRLGEELEPEEEGEENAVSIVTTEGWEE